MLFNVCIKVNYCVQNQMALLSLQPATCKIEMINENL